jgi:hypothetical protein
MLRLGLSLKIPGAETDAASEESKDDVPKINLKGLALAPYGINGQKSDVAKPRFTLEAIIPYSILGKGASSKVHKCMYIPSLTTVAVRSVTHS